MGAVLYATCRLCGPIYAKLDYVPGDQVALADCPGCRNLLVFSSRENANGKPSRAPLSEQTLKPVPVGSRVKELNPL